MLCNDCHKLIQRADIDSYDISLPQSRAAVREEVTVDQFLVSLKANCYLCTRLQLELGNEKWDFIFDRDVRALLVTFDKVAHNELLSPNLISLRLGCKLTPLVNQLPAGDSWSHGYLQVSVIPQKTRLTLSPIVIAAKDATSTGESEVFSLVNHWLNSCLGGDEHSECRRLGGSLNTSPVQYPARLMDLDPEDLPPGQWRLIEISSGSILGPFVTLSHRWGSSTVKLERRTYKSMMTGLPIDTLPTTYQDAVRVIRRLRIRYLWIDSLYERLDIQKEAVRMADIYGNAICNISALSGRHDGLFSPRHPNLVNSDCVFLDQSSFGLKRHYLMNDLDLWPGEMVHMPLTSRGWVLQEEILAPRTIYFGSRQVLWNCSTHRACETYPVMNKKASAPSARTFEGAQIFLQDNVIARITRVLQRASINTIDQLSSSTSSANDDLTYKVWTDFVAHYSLRKLTFPIDKLLAIAGIANMFYKVFRCKFVAGLWARHFEVGLLWYIRKNTRTGTPLEYRAPTWSWASKEGYVIHADTFEPDKASWIVARALEAESHIEGDTHSLSTAPLQLGLVTSARLRLQAPCLRLQMTPLGDWALRIDQQLNNIRLPHLAIHLDATDQIIDPQQVYIGAIIRTTVHRPGVGKKMVLAIQGLVLVPIPDQVNEIASYKVPETRYKRIAYFTIEHRKSNTLKPAWAPGSDDQGIFPKVTQMDEPKQEFVFDRAIDFLEDLEII